MKRPDIPKNEVERQEAVDNSGLLDTLEEKEFDALTEICAEITNSPISLITLVDKNRNWFKSHYGVDFREDTREHSFCGHAINQPSQPFVVNNTIEDIRFADNPLVTGDHKIRFYAGMPILNDDGLPLGTLCVFDNKPKNLNDKQLIVLRKLAKQASILMDHHKKEKQLRHLSDELIEINSNLHHFAKVAAHDLRSPVVSIEEMVKLYQRKYGENIKNKQREILDYIIESTSQLKELVDGSLEHSKVQNILQHKKKTIYLSEIVDYAQSLVDPKREHLIKRSDKHDLLRTNEVALKRIFINLFSNSIKYRKGEKATIEVSFKKLENKFVIKVSDNGPGIHPDFIDKIFNIYERGSKKKSKIQGAGIGLATVKKLTFGIGGKVDVYNNEVGVTFKLELPL